MNRSFPVQRLKSQKNIDHREAGSDQQHILIRIGQVIEPSLPWIGKIGWMVARRARWKNVPWRQIASGQQDPLSLDGSTAFEHNASAPIAREDVHCFIVNQIDLDE